MREMSSVDVELNGIVTADVRAEIVNEFIKYVLYQRSQIPMYLDQIKDLHKRQSTSATVPISGEQKPSSVRQSTVGQQQRQLIDSTDSLFATIRSVFNSGEPVHQVLILLGATVVTPKDCYILNFPTGFYEGTTLSRQLCVSTLFRRLYEADFPAGARPLGSVPTNLFVLFLVPRNCDHQRWRLMPRLTYRVPVTGAHFTVNIVMQPHSVMLTSPGLGARTDSGAAEELDISGIRPLDNSLDGSQLAIVTTPGTAAPSPTCSAHLLDTSNDLEDFVWFQAPEQVRGYKEKVGENGSAVW